MKPIEPIDYETKYYLSKHVEDETVEIDRIMEEHEQMRQMLAVIALLDYKTATAAPQLAIQVLEGK